MKKLVPLWAVLLVLCAADVFAFSCNGRFTSIGMQGYEVLDLCGQPEHVESWQEVEYIWSKADCS